MGVLNALGQTVRLHLQNQLAALSPGGVAGRNKRRGGDKAGQGNLTQRKGEGHHLIPGGIRLEGGVAAALADHAAQIQLGAGVSIAEGLGLGQQRAVFTDQVMSGKHHVGGGLPVARVCIQIGAQQPGGLLADQLAAITGLADGFVAGREVGDHRGTGQRVAGAGRQRRP